MFCRTGNGWGHRSPIPATKQALESSFTGCVLRATVMTRAPVAEPMTADDGHEGRTLASLAFALGLWATVLGILNIVYGIGGTAENKMKVVLSLIHI